MSSAQDPFDIVKEEVQDSLSTFHKECISPEMEDQGHVTKTETNRYDQYGGRDDEGFVQSVSDRLMLLIKQQDEDLDKLSKSVQRITIHEEGGQERVTDELDTEMDSTKNQDLQLRKMLDLVVHASQCRVSHCQYPNCRKVKGLFRHGIECEVRASGGCVLCKKMWYLLQLHSRACKESECHVPRCWDLKEHLRRLEQWVVKPR